MESPPLCPNNVAEQYELGTPRYNKENDLEMTHDSIFYSKQETQGKSKEGINEDGKPLF